jgi:hypothetical protein
MHHSHSQAENLFSRLFSYVPKDSGNETIENYCTEALAWCLIQSRSFRHEFLRLCGLELGDGEFSADVHTQNSFNSEDDGIRGFCDFIIISKSDPKFVFVIESKVWSTFDQNQLPKYRKHLQSGHFKEIPEKSRRLVTLTPTGDPRPNADKNIKWSQVQSLLTIHAKSKPAEQYSATMGQFAAFLEDNGLAPIKLMKITPELLSHCQSAFTLEKALKGIVSKLRNQEGFRDIFGQKQVINNGDGRIGFFVDAGHFGIGMAQIKQKWVLFVHVEICFEDNRLNVVESIQKELKAFYDSGTVYMKALGFDDYANFGNLSDDSTWFAFSETLPSHLYADGDAIFDRLYELSKKAVGFYNKNKAKAKTKKSK